MIISFRERLLLKRADNPNKYPWNSSDQSRVNPKDGTKEVADNRPETLQTIFDLKVDKKRDISKEDIPFINWESINSLDTGRFKSKKEKGEEDAKQKRKR